MPTQKESKREMMSMAMRGSFFCVIISLLLLVRVSESKETTVTALFVFGDSLVDVGNNNYIPFSIAKANFPPYGLDFPGRFPTGRFSNGKNAADFLAEKMGLPSSPPFLSPNVRRNVSSFVTGVSFASGGAGILNGTYHNDILGQSISLSKQVDYYVHEVHGALVRLLEPHNAHRHISRSVFVVVIGSNDLLHYFRWSELRRQISITRYADLMATRLREQLQRLYEHGARKFVVVGAGELGCIPAERLKLREEKCDGDINKGSSTYNEALKSMLEELQSSQLRGMNYSYFASYKAMHHVLNHPTLYGFKETKAGCCGEGKFPCVPYAKYCSDREEYLFWDMYHPTQEASRVFVDFIFHASLHYVFPLNLSMLIAS